MPDITVSHTSGNEWWDERHRFEHWYRDNQIYFITARCRDRFPAFSTDEAKSIFWEQFEKYTEIFHFTPWVTSLIDNHYHTVGHLRVGADLPKLMQRLHGSVAKLVNDVLEANRQERLKHFWIDSGKQNYFDGLLRDELQGRRTFRYVFTQCRRHHICFDPSEYPHARVNVDIERAIERATELKAFLTGVPYARYERGRKRRHAR